MRLTRRNYRLEIDEKTTVAGRPALRVVASPRCSDLETRRFYVDAATFTPLKAESVDELGGIVVQFAVRRIDFPPRLDKDTFLAPTGGERRDGGRPPLPLHGADDAERHAGFRPALPTRLPMGFRVQGMDLLDWHGILPVAVRITDGLVRLNVYQFRPRDDRPSPPPRPGDDKRVSREVGGVRIEVRGDGPMAVRERILATYAKLLEASRTTSP